MGLSTHKCESLYGGVLSQAVRKESKLLRPKHATTAVVAHVAGVAAPRVVGGGGDL